MWRCGRLWQFVGSLWLFVSSLQSFAGGLCHFLVVFGRLLVVFHRSCSFVVVCCGLWLLPVLVFTPYNMLQQIQRTFLWCLNLDFSRVSVYRETYLYLFCEFLFFKDSKIQSCKLYNTKYMIASSQITNTRTSTFIALLVFKLLSCKVLFIDRKDNRNLKSRLLFKEIANFTGTFQID